MWCCSGSRPVVKDVAQACAVQHICEERAAQEVHINMPEHSSNVQPIEATSHPSSLGFPASAPHEPDQQARWNSCL